MLKLGSNVRGISSFFNILLLNLNTFFLMNFTVLFALVDIFSI